MPDTKRCSKCGYRKPVSEYYAKATGRAGLQSWCKECCRTLVNDKHRADPEKYRAGQAEDRAANPERGMLYAARTRAKRKGIPFTLTLEDIFIPERCPLCGVKLTRNTGKRGPGNASPALDRSDPGKGYVPGNILVICHACNRRKDDMTGEQHIEFGRQIIEVYQSLGVAA